MGTVTVQVTDQASHVALASVSYTVGAAPTGVLWGMCSPVGEWDQRAAEVGPGLKSRRVYDGGWNVTAKTQAAVDAGLYPVVSVKPGDWGDVIAGRVNTQLDSLARSLSYFDVEMALTLHHEPGAGEQGTLQEWTQMIAYAATRVRAIAPKVKVGPIDNGFHFDDPTRQGFTDAQLDAYYTPDVLAVFDFLAADCYQGGTFAKPGRDASVKVNGLSRFATRRGWTKALGVGEYNGMDAVAIANAQNAIKVDPRYRWACVFNSSENNRPGVDWVLSGTRLTAFQTVLTA